MFSYTDPLLFIFFFHCLFRKITWGADVRACAETQTLELGHHPPTLVGINSVRDEEQRRGTLWKHEVMVMSLLHSGTLQGNVKMSDLFAVSVACKINKQTTHLKTHPLSLRVSASLSLAPGDVMKETGICKSLHGFPKMLVSFCLGILGSLRTFRDA